MLDASPTAKESGLPAEEWALHDYEGWCGFKIDVHGYPQDSGLLMKSCRNCVTTTLPLAIHGY